MKIVAGANATRSAVLALSWHRAGEAGIDTISSSRARCICWFVSRQFG
jgi:hypothetical protein